MTLWMQAGPSGRCALYGVWVEGSRSFRFLNPSALINPTKTPVIITVMAPGRSESPLEKALTHEGEVGAQRPNGTALKVALAQGALGPRALGPPRATRAP